MLLTPRPDGPQPRRAQVRHPLINLVTIALCSTIAGADDFVAMADWVRQHKNWLGRFLDLGNGIPSHDRLNMIFRRLDPGGFERCLLSWLAALHDTCGGRILAIDGKTARRSFDVAISDTVRGGKACDDVRSYILSKKLNARSFGAAVRGHWGIENALHWQLDMSFEEDRNRTRKDHAAANLVALRRVALSLLKKEARSKVARLVSRIAD